MGPRSITLLGPYPGNRNISIVNYFNFYRRELPKVVRCGCVRALGPGGMTDFDSATPIQRPRMRAWRENYALWPWRLARLDASLFHIVDQGLAWYSRFLSAGKRLITVHDLIAYMSCVGKLDLTPPPGRRRPFVYECVRQIKGMDHVICVSQATADVLVAELAYPANRITVIHHQIDSEFRPLASEERIRERRRWFGDSQHVVIHVGKASVYKNRIGALRAFELLHKRLPGACMFLVHGEPDFQEAAMLAESNCASAVTFTPPISREELRRFYGAADVLIFPSIYEGFGWPPLEAMACGCPVVCSDRASLKEVVGDAALTVSDPHDHRLLAEKMHQVLTSSCDSRELQLRGLERVKQFAPEKALQAVSSVYEQVLRQ